jgi:hypothetical protein
MGMPRVHELPVPAAVDTESVLLGTILTEATQLLTVAEILPPGRGQWFYQDAHRLIYDAMLTLLERHDPIDLETVTDVLRRRGTLDKAGGSVYLAELMEGFVTTANVAHHARIIRDKALYRGMINSDKASSGVAIYLKDKLKARVGSAPTTPDAKPTDPELKTGVEIQVRTGAKLYTWFANDGFGEYLVYEADGVYTCNCKPKCTDCAHAAATRRFAVENL